MGNETGNVSDNFIDDEGGFEQNVEDYYDFDNVTRNIHDALQDAFIDYESKEEKNYCRKGFVQENDIVDELKWNEKKNFWIWKTLLIHQEADCIDSFFYSICYAIRYQKTNKKTKCKDDLELKKNMLNDKLYNLLFNAKDNLRLDLDVLIINAFLLMKF